MDIELTQAIDRVRRAMPRNRDVMFVCDECERLVRTAGETGPVVRVEEPAKPKLTRAQIQKNYRERKKRKTRADRLAVQRPKGDMDE